MKLKTKYITLDEFKEYTGIDLELQLKSDDNPSNTANAFLVRIEKRVESYLDARFYRKVDFEFPKFTDYQKEHYKLALLEQALYVFRNGDISTDSGYDPEKGVVIKNDEKQDLIIAPNAKDNLILCGLWCRKIKNRARSGLDGWWMY